MEQGICHTRAPELAAVLQTEALRDRCEVLWWKEEWLITLQDKFYGSFFCNKGRLALAASCKTNNRYRPLFEFHQDGETTYRGKILDVL